MSDVTPEPVRAEEERVRVALSETEALNCRDALTMLWVKLMDRHEFDAAVAVDATKAKFISALAADTEPEGER